MITEDLPSDWRDLQRMVAAVLEECGFDVEIERSTPTVRGTTEIDVYAEEINRGRKNLILCECKHWKSRVPQNVVHGFRTTVSDTGANVGYIVGSSGFQSGAFEAAELTNIRLLTWQEFQEEFEHQWIKVHVVPTVGDRFEQFLRWTEPLPPSGGRPLVKHEAEAFWALWRSCQPIVGLLVPFEPWMQLGRRAMNYPRLPLSLGEYKDLPDDLLNSSGYRELFDRIEAHADAAVAALRAAAFVD